MTLRLKLFLLMAGVTIFSTSGVTAVALWREVQRGQELLYREGAAMAAQVAATEPLLARLLRAAPLRRAWVVDRSGAVIACLAPPSDHCPSGAPSMFAPAENPVQALHRLIE